jgi:cobalt-zinc-cadmium efflux system protein
MMSLNVKAAFLHVLGDALSSVGVVAAGILMYFTGWYYADPLLSVAIAFIIIFNTGRMMREVVHILLEGAPRKMNLKEIDRTIKGIAGVRDVHNLHVWSITSYMHYLTAHIVVDKRHLKDSEQIMNSIKAEMEKKYRIRHTTLQMESEEYKELGEVHGKAE